MIVLASQNPFQVFSASHGIAVVAGFSIIFMMIVASRKNAAALRLSASTLAFFCLAAYALSQWAWSHVTHNVALDNIIPLHLCDLAAFIGGYALLTRKEWACNLTYFWGLAATLQALITPNAPFDVPHPTWFTFFLHHFAIVGTALFIPLCLNWRPQQPWWKAAIFAFIAVNGYLLLATIANVSLGTNFGFIARPPDNPSLIDHLGPWPWYIASFEVIALVLFCLLALPFRKSKPTHA